MANNTIHTSEATDIFKGLNSRLRENKAWADLFKAVSKVITERVTKPRQQLAEIRDPTRYRRGQWITLDDGSRAIINHVAVSADAQSFVLHAQIDGLGKAVEIAMPFSNIRERDVLVNNAKFHGFSFFSDTLSDLDYARINDWVEHYWPEGGTPNFARFIGFIKNMRLEVDQLWSIENPARDEYPFLEVEATTFVPVWLGGDYYPTSHVQLRYDAVLNRDVDLVELFYLFYYIAPIHLVLQRIVGEVVVPPIIINRLPPQAQLGMVDYARHEIELKANMTHSVLHAPGGIGMVDRGVLVLVENGGTLTQITGG